MPHLLRYRGTLLLGLVFLAATNAAALYAPWVLKLAIDDLTLGAERQTMAAYAALLVAVALVVGGFRFLMRRVLIGLSRQIEYDLRNELFARLTRMDARWYLAHPTGDLMNRLVNDLSSVRMALGPGIMNVFNTGVVFLAVSVLLLRLDPGLALLALAPVPLLSLVEKILGRRYHARYTAAQEELSRLSTLTQENLAGIRVVQAYAQEERQGEAFERQARRVLDRNLAASRLGAAFHPLMSLLAGCSLLLVLWFGGSKVVRGELSLGGFVAFQSYLALLVWPMIALGWVLNLFERGAASMSRLSEILDARPAIDEPSPGRALSAPRGEIEAEEVSFQYPGSREPALSGVSFRLPAGRRLGVVGETGSGKSTLVRLLVRLIDPGAGEIRLDGIPLRELPLDDLRRAVALVPQESVLFSDTIRANIAFAPEPVTGEALEQALAHARLDEEVRGFPDGLETRVGERGVTLSGGQKSRTAIARALVRPAAVLILDDVLAAVDAGTEEALLANLERESRGRTAVIVSHRVSAVRLADEILVLRQGRIVERGSYAELLARGGYFAALERRQRLEQELRTA